MRDYLRRFALMEDGAVTIDWVVLTAALLTLGILIGTSVSNGAETMAQNTGDNLAAAVVPEVVF